MSLIVVYSSTMGNTKAVANYIAEKTEGKAVDVSSAKREDIESNDTIIFGGRVWGKKIPKKLMNFIADNKDILDTKRVALYVCAGRSGEKGKVQCDKIADSVGIKNRASFCKGKKLVKTGDEIDKFISSL